MTPCAIQGCPKPRIGPDESRPFCWPHSRALGDEVRTRIRVLGLDRAHQWADPEGWQTQYDAAMSAAHDEVTRLGHD